MKNFSVLIAIFTVINSGFIKSQSTIKILQSEKVKAPGKYSSRVGLPEYSFKSEDGKTSRFFYQGTGGVTLLGFGAGGSDYDIETIGVGAYFNPKLAFDVDKVSSVCAGTNLQFIIDSDLAIAFAAPLTVGLNIGSGSHEETDYAVGGFVNVGLGPCVIADEETYSFLGMYVDAGLRIDDTYELRASVMREPKKGQNGMMLGLGFGICF